MTHIRYNDAVKTPRFNSVNSAILCLVGLFCMSSLMVSFSIFYSGVFMIMLLLQLFMCLEVTYAFSDNRAEEIIIIDDTSVEAKAKQNTTMAFLYQPLNRNVYESETFPETTPISLTENFIFEQQPINKIQTQHHQTSTETKYIQKRFLQFQNHKMSPNEHEPKNHRRQFDEVTIKPPRPFGHPIIGNQPIAFHNRPNHSFPHIPKDYSGQVDNIQDIIEQISDQMPNDGIESLPAYVARTGRMVRFGGTYRHRKSNDVTGHWRSPQSYRSESNAPLTPSPPISADPFYPYKPQSMAEVNLMALHEFRFAPTPFAERKQNIRVKKPIHIASELYQQLIRANNQRAEADRMMSRDGMSKKQKPFSLMLDVYPMPDDEPSPFPTTTRRPLSRPVLRKPHNELSYKYLPARDVTNPNNFPLHYEQQYFKNMHFPQIYPYRHQIQNIHQERDNNYNGQNYNFHRLGGAPARPPSDHATENRASQITVHLNLFPKNKQPIINQRKDRSKGDNQFLVDDNVSIYNNLRNRVGYHVSTTTESILQKSKVHLANPATTRIEPGVVLLTSTPFSSTNFLYPDNKQITSSDYVTHLTPTLQMPPAQTSARTKSVYSLNDDVTPTPSTNLIVTSQPQSDQQQPPTIVSTTWQDEIASVRDTPINTFKFDEHFRLDVSTSIPIEPRQMLESPFSNDEMSSLRRVNLKESVDVTQPSIFEKR